MASRKLQQYRSKRDSSAVTRGPSLDPAQKRLAVEVEDPPLDYGDFEGTIPKGEYGGGTVQLWDRGHWIAEQPSAAKALEDGELKFALEGERLHGSLRSSLPAGPKGGTCARPLSKGFATTSRPKRSVQSAQPCCHARSLRVRR